MDITLKNDFIEAKIANKGAELQQLFHLPSQTERLWHGDAAVWGRHAPVLFPIVGKLKDNQYSFQDKQYQMSQHGFARDRNFACIEQRDDRVIFELRDDEETRKVFPFPFVLTIQYILSGERISIHYTIDNPEKSTPLLCSIGAHPGFRVPFHTGMSFEDYQVIFDTPETLDLQLLNDSGARSWEVHPNYLQEDTSLSLYYSLFDRDALIFAHPKSKSVSISTPKASGATTVGIDGFPYLGIWNKPKANAPFLCIEPWHGVADHENHNGQLRDKEGIIEIAPGKSFSCDYWIEVTA